MATVNLPIPKQGNNAEENVQYLTDAFYKLRKELSFLLENLDSDNVLSAKTAMITNLYAGTITASQIDVSAGKITTAQIETLTVGGNVVMGPNATISWANVSDHPTDILTQGNFATVITKDYIASMNLLVGNEIQMGANATISWANVSSKPSIPTNSDITTICANYISTPNLYTNIATVSTSLTLGSGSDYGTLLFKSGVRILAYDDAIGFGMKISANTVLFDYATHVDFTLCSNVNFAGVAVNGLNVPATFG